MEKWRRVWREGFVPNFSEAGLCALLSGLINNDGRLLQGLSFAPPPLAEWSECAVEGACAISYTGWRGEGRETIGELEQYFNEICERADAVFSEPAACRFFFNWYDDTPREVMRRELLAEVTLALRGKLESLAA